ncbi:beta-ketoacyl synthase N-terminal-like domain-containing protein [Nitrosospira sp. Nsp13]|uniref:beta-ketoacyl synthase N-terminal-like domain-containing protein n=1 Tax=Nitrosospira sp. Nsp13 TaxID=1855332 RepID=UPI0008850431|nr:beta-ketoacyl synthase N-terminal-like domain-containing protein [Nitrosospira sp. Nsp13]SCX77866.1 3-oxoacyl-[acyl-carrier-protein] synthase-1 [Nitrosospira sp. Nsp13]
MAVPRTQILGLGASTPIGRNVWASAAAARAGICGFSEHPFMIDTAGEPMRIARAPWLDVGIEGVERYCTLLFPAIDEALAPIQQLEQRPVKVGLALGLPPSRPGQPVDLSKDILGAIAQRYTGFFVYVISFEAGHAAGLLAMDAAIKSCTAQSVEACVVAGVDSYLAPETLEWIEECDQLHGGGPLNNAWGFIPGEAAGALLISTGEFAHQNELESFGEIIGVGISREIKLIKTDEVCVGEGLTQAFRAALHELMPGEQVHNVFCDLNGETYRADEYGFTALRTKEYFRAVTDFITPADCWGDIGAASVVLYSGLAVICHRKRYGKGPLSMVWASSEMGERGAMVIRGLDPGQS